MTDVLIVGAGLAGLACARELTNAGISCEILEASDAPGGRARTDAVDGFLLDRGFQVLLTAYPEAKRQLNYDELKLRRFAPGALVRFRGRFHSVVDPWRRPSEALSTLASPIGTLLDKMNIARLRVSVTTPPLESLFKPPVGSTMGYLRGFGFSSEIIERFFRPFFGGIFLERELETSSDMFQFVFRMFAEGEAALPSAGMGAMADQLASRLPQGCIRFGQQVNKVAAGSVTLASGEQLSARAVVVATDNATAAQLLPGIPPLRTRGTLCFYFAAPRPPVSEPMLVLNGDGDGPVNNLCVPSVIAPSYAPGGAHLVSATVVRKYSLTDADLLAAVRQQLTGWFGRDVHAWLHLRTDWIPHALPEQSPAIGAGSKNIRIGPGLFVCGDHRDSASINGALLSGRRVAEAISRS